MTFKIFLEFIRLNAKAASVVPYFIGVLFSIYYFHAFNWINSLIYLVAQVAIALFVTGFNNVQITTWLRIYIIGILITLLAVSTYHHDDHWIWC